MNKLFVLATKRFGGTDWKLAAKCQDKKKFV
jgi:hypothetical protein